MESDVLAFFTGVLLIASGVIVMLMGMRHRSKVLEMMHRERLAMIERGLAPSPERDPRQFYETFHVRRRSGLGSRRSLSGGIVVVGFGLGLAMLIGFAGGSPEIATGIGGAIAILGAAFIVTSLVNRGDDSVDLPPTPRPPLAEANDLEKRSRPEGTP